MSFTLPSSSPCDTNINTGSHPILFFRFPVVLNFLIIVCAVPVGKVRCVAIFFYSRCMKINAFQLDLKNMVLYYFHFEELRETKGNTCVCLVSVFN